MNNPISASLPIFATLQGAIDYLAITGAVPAVAVDPSLNASRSVSPMANLKLTATRADIVNDFYDQCQILRESFKAYPEALQAIEAIEGLAVWWMNAPAVVSPTE